MLIERLASKYKDISENDEQAQEWLTRINECVIHMRSLIDDLSEFSGVSYEVAKKDKCNTGDLVKEILLEISAGNKRKKSNYYTIGPAGNRRIGNSA